MFVFRIDRVSECMSFNSVISDLACGWFGRFVVFPNGSSPISGTCKFLPPSGRNPSCEVGPPSGGNPSCGVGPLSVVWNLVGLLVGVIPAIE